MVRRHNLALVLGCVADGEPVSRAGVAARTGLTRGTVSSLVEELLAARLVAELAAHRGGTGRPAAPLQLNRSGPAGLGLEIGIDHVGACVVDLTGAVRAIRREPSAHRDEAPEVGLRAAARLGAEVAAAAGLAVAGTCVALPGAVRPDGVLSRAPNLPRWVDVDVASFLDGPATAGNEADLAALGELWFGSGSTDVVYVSADIGIGAGVVIGGELFRGPGGRAGELGHVVVDPGGPVCRCGGRGCLERVAGLEAMLAAAGAADVDELAARPGPTVEPVARALGIALTGTVALLDVRTVVLGGVHAQLGEPQRAAVAHELGHLDPPVDVRLATPATGGAVRGAAASVVRSLIRAPHPSP